MTNQEIIQFQRKQKALHESGQTIAARLREAANVDAYGAALMSEAAEVIEHLQERIARMNREAREEEREVSRAIRESYAEGRHEGLTEGRGDW